MNQGKIETAVELLLEGLGCDLKDRNYLETPERVARMYIEMFAPREREWATFPETYSDFIMLKGHHMYSMCPHHLLPVEFNVTVAYIPGNNVLGLSKLARVCDEANTGPVLQEKFTQDVVENLVAICPGTLGVACIVNGQHGCTKVRGIKSDAWFTTYKLHGEFANNEKLEKRFFQLARY